MNETMTSIDDHLKKAFVHIEKALAESIQQVLDNERKKDEIGRKWEAFIGQLFHLIRKKGKENRINLMSWVSFTRLRKWMI
ncbi:hypothetical protein C8P63_11192 [Melghirimyces profundicolus]|uniref:Uncharacterized protein n=1 Tax=Melghirimyces profundicolus TaxID=1242148 RepID=A0A2T6BUK8_9BACL|nr:hypothetical protein [Melghirimyces profundicolus]PTX59657.1 hypothetical protein C8P63_11192 [Melghirimyces profundicolus]